MGLLRYYLRVFFRSNFKPIKLKTAKKWEFNSSLLYFITAWMVFGVASQMFMKSAEEGKLGDARVYDPYQMMLRFGSKKTFTVLDVAGGSVEKRVLSLDELEKKASEE